MKYSRLLLLAPRDWTCLCPLESIRHPLSQKQRWRCMCTCGDGDSWRWRVSITKRILLAVHSSSVNLPPSLPILSMKPLTGIIYGDRWMLLYILRISPTSHFHNANTSPKIYFYIAFWAQVSWATWFVKNNSGCQSELLMTHSLTRKELFSSVLQHVLKIISELRSFLVLLANYKTT